MMPRRDPARGPARATGSDRRPLVHQRRERHRPALVDVAQAVIVGDADLVEEHLVEAGPARHLTQRPDLHARRPHVDDEPGEALVLGLVGVGAADDLADVGVLRAGRPHLLAGDAPLVAVALGAGLEAGQVRARTRLGEQLAADDVTTVHLRAGSGPSPSPTRGRGWSAPPCRGRCRRRPGAEPRTATPAMTTAGRRRSVAASRRTAAGPVIQPKPASNVVARHSRAWASSLRSRSGVRSSNSETESVPSPQTRVRDSGRRLACASRKLRASCSNSSRLTFSCITEQPPAARLDLRVNVVRDARCRPPAHHTGGR